MRIPYLLYFPFVILVFFCGAFSGHTQELPPRPVEVETNSSQFLNFGAFTTGNGRGTVSVDYSGTRSYSGDVYLLNMGEPASPALFDVTANPGTILNVLVQEGIILQGENGGQLRLELDSFSPGKMFISRTQPPHVNSLYMGGTLYLENISANPPGRYSGTFTITLIHQ